MSQTKVQLIAPIGVVTASTLETTGVLTATTFVGDLAGTVTGITSTTDNLDVGILTATAFVGDFTGTASSIVTGSNVTVGIITATKFVGNTPGTVSGLADDTNINVGIITSTSFVGDLTGNAAGLSTTTANLSLGIVTATSFAGNITGNAAGISITTSNANLGIITASAFHGSGANLDGVSAGPVSQQAVTANGATTTIDLSSGNVIYMTQSANTSVSFANTEGNTDVVYLIRTKDDTGTARTITWPSGLVWSNDTEPTLLSVSKPAAYEAQVFKLTTRDNGATWYGVEVVNHNVDQPGELWAWGDNSQGQLGQNNLTQYSSPVQIPGTTWEYYDMSGSMSAGIDYLSAVIKEDNTLWHWGGGQYGAMGVNDNSGRSSPIQVPGSWATISHDIAAGGVKTDGTMWGWGLNQTGQIGNSSQTYMSSPIQIPGTNWGTKRQQLAKSRLCSLAVKNDGTLWSWGGNSDGELGLNDRTKYSSPVQIPGTTWSQVFRRRESSYAIKTDGTLWAWGGNNNGNLGQNNRTSYSSPVQVGSDSTWRSGSAGLYSILATKTDNTLWAWGFGNFGGLGLNNQGPSARYSSPVQLPGTTWNTVSSGYYNSAATKTDGTLWTWGWNDDGGLGLNDAGTPGNEHANDRSSPVQVPGTNWISVSTNGRMMFGLRSAD